MIPAASSASARRLLVFTKPAVPGRVKTRLIGDLSARQTALLHQAFLTDVCTKLSRASGLCLGLAWALEGNEQIPTGVGALNIPGLRQEGETLGDRLWHGLSRAAGEGVHVAALGSDHPEITAAVVVDAFDRLDAGADVVIGPSFDGGYYLIALADPEPARSLFHNVPWSTEKVLEITLRRAKAAGLRVDQLAEGHDVDLPQDLERLKGRLRHEPGLCPATYELLAAWGQMGRQDGHGEDAP